MGCDGGTIPKRDELVRTKKKPEQKDKNSERAFRWKHCAISQQPLQKPVVACEAGRLYNKESVLETLLNKVEGTPTPEVAAHIRTLRDVKELELTENPTWDAASSSNAEVGDAYIDVQKSQWVCPVSSQEMNGTFRFSFIWSCGCVLSEKALKEMRKTNSDSLGCLRCQKPFSFDDVIIINPTDEEHEGQVEKMSTRRLLAKKSKKNSKKRGADAVSTGSPEESVNGTVKVKEEPEEGSSKELNLQVTAVAGSSKPNGITSSSIPMKRSKLSTDKAEASGKSSKVKDYSVSEDPNASEAYKSLFTTHTSAQSQQKAHWVTYNPFYN